MFGDSVAVIIGGMTIFQVVDPQVVRFLLEKVTKYIERRVRLRIVFHVVLTNFPPFADHVLGQLPSDRIEAPICV